MKIPQWLQLRPYGYAAIFAASFQASQVLPQFPNRAPVAVGQKLADGQAYVTLVQLKHQANAADNGRILISFEENGMAGLPHLREHRRRHKLATRHARCRRNAHRPRSLQPALAA
jgi:hypothetical protein